MVRASGLLLHPTSLPGPHGVGDLGPAAYRFVDLLAASGQTVWQVLPLSPPGYGSSPYAALSSMAGNPMLVSLEALAADGWLQGEDLERAPALPSDRADFGAVIPLREALLRKAAGAFFARADREATAAYEAFCRAHESWLRSWARYAALKEANGGRAWTDWSAERKPDPAGERVHRFVQFVFYAQWSRLRRHARERGIRIVGDIPIFVAHDSADVWSHPELFDLDARGAPRTVAGVPPDYFSATGQLWGNPLYRWDVLAASGYRWWIERVRAALELVDVVRLDHFRGFEKYWEIPASAPTAVEGRWVEGPGERLFAALREALGGLPFIAEDLGFITPEVHALRDRLGLPGMRVLQFAFGDDDPRNPFKPHNYVRNAVVYTGTHDNDTTAGWFHGLGPGGSTRSAEAAEAERGRALRYLASDGREIHWDFVRAALASVADTAIVPLQDLLGLGSEARMNLPATVAGNWQWRVRLDELENAPWERLRELTFMYGRIPQ